MLSVKEQLERFTQEGVEGGLSTEDAASAAWDIVYNGGRLAQQTLKNTQADKNNESAERRAEIRAKPKGMAPKKGTPPPKAEKAEPAKGTKTAIGTVED